MKKLRFTQGGGRSYCPPEITRLNVVVEAGFAISGNIEGIGDGDDGDDDDFNGKDF